MLLRKIFLHSITEVMVEKDGTVLFVDKVKGFSDRR